jgi:hypothetical protein
MANSFFRRLRPLLRQKEIASNSAMQPGGLGPFRGRGGALKRPIADTIQRGDAQAYAITELSSFSGFLIRAEIGIGPVGWVHAVARRPFASRGQKLLPISRKPSKVSARKATGTGEIPPPLDTAQASDRQRCNIDAPKRCR